jgi:hypothetical protein
VRSGETWESCPAHARGCRGRTFARGGPCWRRRARWGDDPPPDAGRDTWPHGGPGQACQSGRVGRSASSGPIGTSRRMTVGDARGNSRRCRESLFCVSGIMERAFRPILSEGYTHVTRPGETDRRSSSHGCRTNRVR